MKILVNVPDLKIIGGVSNYYLTIKNYLNSNVSYNTIGTRAKEKHYYTKILRFLYDYIKFIKQILFDKPALIVLNPSLGHYSVIRDGIFCVIAFLFSVKTLVFFRGWDVKIEKIYFGKFLFLMKIFYWHSNSLIVLSDSFKQKFINHGYKKPIYIETTIVDDLIFNICLLKEKDIITKNRKTRLAYLSRITKGKGVLLSIKVFQILQLRFKNLELYIAGDGPLLIEAKKYVKLNQLKNIKFTGFISGKEKFDFYLNADIFLFPSYGEGLPNSVLEAMAFGLPVITRPVGGLKDLFINGKMGLITNSKDPKVFAKLLEQLINEPDKRKKISEYNFAYARKHFKATHVAKRIDKIYNEILN